MIGGQVLSCGQDRQRSPAFRLKEEWKRCAHKSKRKVWMTLLFQVQSFLSPRCIPHLDLWDNSEAVQSLSSPSYQVFWPKLDPELVPITWHKVAPTSVSLQCDPRLFKKIHANCLEDVNDVGVFMFSKLCVLEKCCPREILCEPHM